LDGGSALGKATTYIGQQRKKYRHASVSQAGIESMTPMFKLARTFRDLDGTASVLDACREYVCSIKEM
jgi:hypothetical protein